jgi:hypothetical protein
MTKADAIIPRQFRELDVGPKDGNAPEGDPSRRASGSVGSRDGRGLSRLVSAGDEILEANRGRSPVVITPQILMLSMCEGRYRRASRRRACL